MRIAVIGATGRAGRLILKEALSRGHKVTAVVRDVYIVPDSRINVIESDIFSLRCEDLAEEDVVIDAFGVWERSKAGQHIQSLTHLCDILSGRDDVRLMVVGGAANLYVDAAKTVRIIDLEGFPKGAYPIAKAMCDAYDMLKQRDDFYWTYVCPAPDFKQDGEKNGVYRIAGDVLPKNGRGKSEISYADYAAAIVDEAEKGGRAKEMITIYEA